MKSLRLRDVSVRFGTVNALDGVTLTLASGEVTMLVGPNGAGKSTLLRVLLGLVRPQAGSLEVDGRPHRVDRRFKAAIGYLPEAVAFSDNLSGRAVLRFFARARGLPLSRADEALDRVGLSAAARRAVRGYSRGMRQRLGLAQAILSNPELLILDEPTGGLDQEGLSVLWTVLDEWREAKRMVLLTAHDLALLERRVSTMCVLRKGRLVASGPPQSLRRDAALPHRVHLSLAENANGQVRELVAAAEGLGDCSVERDGQVLTAEVAPGALRDFMGIQARYPEAVVDLRVEEAPLDMVYERLLEAE